LGGAINDKGEIDPETRRRVLDVPKDCALVRRVSKLPAELVECQVALAAVAAPALVRDP
jgi:hypothetical protein